MRFKALAFFAAIFLSLALASPAQAALALTHKGSNSVGTGTTASVTALTISNGDLIVVGGSMRLAANADTVTISDTAGDTFTYYEYPTGSTTSIRTFVAFAKTTGLSGGSVTMTTSGGSVLDMGLSVEDVTGFDTTTVEDTAARNTAQATSTTPAITTGTPTYSGDLFFSSFSYGNQTYTEDAAWTNTAKDVGNTNSKFATAYYINPASATATRTGTISASTPWKALVIGIKAAGGGGPTLQGGTLLRGAGK